MARKRVGYPLLFRRTMKIPATCRPDDVSLVVDERSAQKGTLDAAGELLTLKGRVSLPRLRICGAHGKGLVRVGQDDIGVEARSDVALVEQTEPPGRIPTQEFSHAIVRQTALAPLAEDARQQIFGAAETGLSEPDVWVV